MDFTVENTNNSGTVMSQPKKTTSLPIKSFHANKHEELTNQMNAWVQKYSVVASQIKVDNGSFYGFSWYKE